MAKLGIELFKKMQAIQGHAYLSDAIEEMSDDRVLELVPIILEWQEEGVKVLREFLRAAEQSVQPTDDDDPQLGTVDYMSAVTNKDADADRRR